MERVFFIGLFIGICFFIMGASVGFVAGRLSKSKEQS